MVELVQFFTDSTQPSASCCPLKNRTRPTFRITHSRERLVDGWETCKTENGIPYYVNHKVKKTQWDHPLFIKLLEELGEHDSIKYAAYRTAQKITSFQSKFATSSIDLKAINSVLHNFGYEEAKERWLHYTDLWELMLAVSDSCRRPGTVDALLASNRQPREINATLMINLLLNMYDENRSGCVRLGAVKVFLATLSSSRLSEKYKYYFQQNCDDSNHLDRKRMGQLLYDLIQFTRVIGESQSFGGTNVNAAVQSCFSQAWGTSAGLTEDEWLRWLLQEPQTTVWLPTLHRLAAAQAVQHDAKCGVCKMNPIQGLRYKCLKCFKYDLCQQCFLTGKISKKHKGKHPTQEYCFNTSTKEDTKAFMRTVRNNFSKKHRNKRKPRYLPVETSNQPFQPETMAAPPGTESVHNDTASTASTSRATRVPVQLSETPVLPAQEALHSQGLNSVETHGFNDSERRELASIIQHLETENNYLMQQLECMYERSRLDESPCSSQSRDSVVSESDDSDWAERDKMAARQEVLESHNVELNRQLTRLRSLLHVDERNATEEFQHRKPLSPISVNTKIRQHSPSRPKHQHHLYHDQNTSDSLSHTHFHPAANDSHSLRGSYYAPSFHSRPVVPRLQLSKLVSDASEQYCATPLPGYQNAPPKPEFETPESCIDPASASTSAYKTQQLYTPNSVELTFGCIDSTLGRTHYTINSPEDSRDFRNEEAEMAALVAQLDQDMAMDLSKHGLEESLGVKGEMLRAAAGIGQAFAHTPTHAQDSMATSKRFEDSSFA